MAHLSSGPATSGHPLATRRYSRRRVLALSAAAGAAALAACSGEETGSDATTGPDPTEEPPAPTGPDIVVADLDALVRAWERAHLLDSQAASIQGLTGPDEALVAQARGAFAVQIEVLTALLEAGTVPLPDPPTYTPPADLDPGGDTGTGTATPDTDSDRDTATTTADPDEELEVAEREAAERDAEAQQQLRTLAQECAADAGPAALTDLAQLSSANLGMLTAIAGSRGGLAQQLGRAAPTTLPTGPRGTHAAQIVTVLRPAVYVFEVLAAQTTVSDREVYQTPLTALRRLTRALIDLGGLAVPPPPLGFEITEDVSDPEGRRALAAQVLAPIPSAVAAQAHVHHGDLDSVTGSVQILSEAVGWSHGFGLPLEPFPGMEIPSDG